MTTPRKDRDRTFARSTVLALAMVVAGAACVTAPPPPKYKPPTKDTNVPLYVFTVDLGGSPCQITLKTDWANCNTSLPPNAPDPKQPKDCTRAKFDDARVEFVGPAGKPFKLEFDPFGQSSLTVTGTSGPLSFVRDAGKPQGQSKTYTFRVTAPGCRPYDPEIIVDW
jgi:hypothetical protein